MKQSKFRLFVIVVVVVGLLAAVLPAGADTPVPIYGPLNVGWDSGCTDNVSGPYYWGWVVVTWNIYAPTGFKVVYSDTYESGLWFGGTFAETYEYVWPQTETYAFEGYFWIPGDGSFEREWSFYDPNGNMVSQAYLYGNCLTGELSWHGGSIYDPMPPSPASRVMGTVVGDTPVYSAPDPAQALGDTLKQGQTWFAVSCVKGTDGGNWYQVFVGGYQYPYVPASKLALDGALDCGPETAPVSQTYTFIPAPVNIVKEVKPPVF